MRLSLFVLLLVACAKPTEPPPTAVPTPSGAAVGAPCQQSTECAGGLCEGQGCDVPGHCVDPRQRACTEDLVTYCGCDGKDMVGSSSCPGGRYAHRGECQRADAASPDAAPPPDAAVAAAPAVKKADPLFACAGDGDCAIWWREVGGCFPGDPVAIRRGQEALARSRLPQNRDRMGGCGMGGPQYDAQRRAHDARYGVTCKTKRCEMIDRGPQKADPLGL